MEPFSANSEGNSRLMDSLHEWGQLEFKEMGLLLWKLCQLSMSSRYSLLTQKLLGIIEVKILIDKAKIFLTI